MVDESYLACPRLQYARGWDGQLPSHRNRQADVDEHTWRELHAGIRKNKPDALGARRHVHLRPDEIHPSAKSPAIHGDGGGISNLDPPDIGLEYLGIDPHRGEVGYGVKFGLRLHVQVGKGVALGDVT